MKKRLLTAQAAQALDRDAHRARGISTLTLMENAGAAVARAVRTSYQRKKKIAVFCGKGNNGGDGLVAARHLLAWGIQPDIFLACGFSDVRHEAKTNLRILASLRQKIIPVTDRNIAGIDTRKYGCIIDALLGVGIQGEVRGIYHDLIGLINASKARVLSVDIPSGLDATTGKVWGVCVKADMTITFVARKRGMVIGSGPRHCGKVIVADLGVPL